MHRQHSMGAGKRNVDLHLENRKLRRGCLLLSNSGETGEDSLHLLPHLVQHLVEGADPSLRHEVMRRHEGLQLLL